MRASDLNDIKFKQKISGYGKTEVDEFIHKVRVSMEKLEAHNKDLQEQLNEANKEVDAAQRKEATVNRSIFVAQEAADRLREEALNEASLIVERSEAEARHLLAEAAEKAAVVNTETDNLQEAARTYLHQSFGMILQAKDMYEDPRWENLFFDRPVGKVATPQLDEIVRDYDLPVRSDKGEAIFDDAVKEAEKHQRKEEFFNNDIPAIAPVLGQSTGSTRTLEQASVSEVSLSESSESESETVNQSLISEESDSSEVLTEGTSNEDSTSEMTSLESSEETSEVEDAEATNSLSDN